MKYKIKTKKEKDIQKGNWVESKQDPSDHSEIESETSSSCSNIDMPFNALYCVKKINLVPTIF